MSLCSPSMKLKAYKRLPWLTKPLLVEMKKRDTLHPWARKTGQSSVWDLYKKQRDKTITLLRTAKSTHFSGLKGANSKCSDLLYAPLTSQPPQLQQFSMARLLQLRRKLTSFSQCFNMSVQPLQFNFIFFVGSVLSMPCHYSSWYAISPRPSRRAHAEPLIPCYNIVHTRDCQWHITGNWYIQGHWPRRYLQTNVKGYCPGNCYPTLQAL